MSVRSSAKPTRTAHPLARVGGSLFALRYRMSESAQVVITRAGMLCAKRSSLPTSLEPERLAVGALLLVGEHVEHDFQRGAGLVEPTRHGFDG